MLEDDHLRRINDIIETVSCAVQLPRGLFEHLSQTGVGPVVASDARQYARTRTFSKAALQVWQSIPSVERKPQVFTILTKNLSHRSIGFFHAKQLYPGEQHFIFLNSTKMTCTVRRCVRRGDRCYEIGSTFSQGEKNR